MIVIRTMDQLLDRIVKPALAAETAAFAHIRTGVFKSLNVIDFLRTEHSSLLSKAQSLADKLMSDVKLEVDALHCVEGDYSIVDLEIGDDLDVEEVYGVDDDRGFMSVSVDCVATVDGFVFKSDYYGLSDDAPIAVMDGDWNDHYMWVQVEIKARLTVNMTIAEADGQVYDWEVKRLTVASY